jgi:hypothetical protein
MRDVDGFLDAMAEQDDERRMFSNFLAEARAEYASVLATTKAIASEHQARCFALVRETVRELADEGLTAKQIADAVDQIFKN